MTEKEKILGKLKDVPQLPVAAVKVMELLQNAEYDTANLIKTIEHDPGLTTNILKLANSAHFGASRSISSLRDAVVRLGTRQVEKLIITAAVAPLARQDIKGYGLPPGELLKHCVAVAVGVEQTARIIGVELPSYAFTAGLLHDMGKVVMGTFVEVDETPITRMVSKKGIPFDEAERKILGIDHAEVGAALLRQWQIPEEIIETVRWHHHPSKAKVEKTVCEITHIADIIALGSGIGAGLDGLKYEVDEDVMVKLKLKARTMEMIVVGIMNELEGLKDSLQFEL